MPDAATFAAPGFHGSLKTKRQSLLRCCRRELVPLRCRWIDNRRYLQHPIRRKSATPGMLANNLRVGSDVHASNLVLGHVALHPLNARTELLQHVAGFLRDRLEL